MGLFLTDAQVAASAFDFSTIDFSTVTSTFVAALGVSAGVAITFIAIRKGWSMLKKTLKGA